MFSNQHKIESLFKKSNDLKEKFIQRKAELITLIGDSDLQIILAKLGIPPKALVHIMVKVLNLPDTAKYSNALTIAKLSVNDKDFEETYKAFEQAVKEMETALNELKTIVKICEAALYAIIYNELLTLQPSSDLAKKFAKEIEEAKKFRDMPQAHEFVNAFKKYCSYFGKESENIEAGQCVTKLDAATAKVRTYASQIDSQMENCEMIQVQLASLYPTDAADSLDKFIENFQDYLRQLHQTNNQQNSNNNATSGMSIKQWIESKLNNPDEKLISLLQRYSAHYLGAFELKQLKNIAAGEKKQAEKRWEEVEKELDFRPPNFLESLGELGIKFLSTHMGIIDTVGKKLTSKRKEKEPEKKFVATCATILRDLYSGSLPKESDQYIHSKGDYYKDFAKQASPPVSPKSSRHTQRSVSPGPGSSRSTYSAYPHFSSTTTTSSSTNSNNNNQTSPTNNNNRTTSPPPQRPSSPPSNTKK